MKSSYLELETGRLRQDIRHASRMLGKNPGFAFAAVATLALGIGANTAMFGVVHAILLRSLPFPEPGRLISVTDVLRMQAALVVLRDGSRTTDYVAYSGNTEFNLTGQREPARLAGSTVSSNLFTVLGQGPVLGQTFQNGEDGGLCGAWAATRVLRSFLFQITATDTVTFVSMPLVLTAVALLATYVPARRAARVDPAITLRYE
jgi:ABC-type antimicrobial peptide transport system permease subunit